MHNFQTSSRIIKPILKFSQNLALSWPLVKNNYTVIL